MSVPRRDRRLVLVGLVVLASTLLPGCSDRPGPEAVLHGFSTAWSKGELRFSRQLADERGRALDGEAARRQLTGLLGDLKDLRPVVGFQDPIEQDGDDATATLTVAWPLAAKVRWDYEVPVRLRRTGDVWRIVFGPTTVHPDLTASDRLTLQRTAGAARGAILDGAGQPIVTQRPVVVVGFQPSAIRDLTLAMAQLKVEVNTVEPAVAFPDLPDRIKAAKPDAFVEAVTLRRDKYLKIRAGLQSIDGTRFREETRSLAPTATFARALLGVTGEVTREIMEKNPGTYQVGDRVGLSGVQHRYDGRLRATPAMRVDIAAVPGRPARTLFTSDAIPGDTVRTTLDQAVQTAAERALAGQSGRSALVAMHTGDGALLAVANGPDGGQQNLALLARVPPGSTFKMVTALGVLAAEAATAETIVPCPRTLTVDGRTFTNAHGMALGDVPLRVDFARSCNTAFAALAPRLGADGLARTAESLGIGKDWEIGMEAFWGQVSSGGSATERG
ncbi:MAG: penicillin-binding protein, partial [Dactylosporangium sp.]|nr:penicillin-binding protein [Dactylosporangium sp.]NNJ59460.1 penicillin-binding protein [Dactylosporangium sp.]